MRYAERFALVRAHFRAIKPYRARISRLAVERLAEFSPQTRALALGGGVLWAERFADALRSAVYGTRRLDDLEDSLLAMGAQHAAMGLGPEVYPALRHAVLRSLAETLGDSLNEPIRESWDAFLLCAVGMLTRGNAGAEPRAAARAA
ncbi:MAG: hypothetical protein HRU70_14350 [Phycisphaeraceae bacterium]|nr:MAG: hypothetical protein HRU70_14350 [Phycisphaeraceae bacterium]